MVTCFCAAGSLITSCAPATYAAAGAKVCNMTNAPAVLPQGLLTFGMTSAGTAIRMQGSGTGPLIPYFNDSGGATASGALLSSIATPVTAPAQSPIPIPQVFCY